ncbi:unnamed protein product [Caenorhabditis auriculariae]|uniref:Uncharacterized protein n=1 Tax=Caenorhabditis auriculariae TaxID=2777116 RepID=A0A8S1H8N5_9PELO|nr:unnamed protein product [Caenorhabditis auriculariae]
MLHVLSIFSMIFVVLLDARGVSHKKSMSGFGERFHDSTVDEFPCEKPPFTSRLPIRIRTKVELIWKDVERNGNCWVEMARTRNLLLRLTAEERSQIAKPPKDCRVPDVVHQLPKTAKRRIMKIWKDHKTGDDCWEQQKRTRLLLLNLPMTMKKLLHPPTFDCALPHFIDRLEPDLQKELRDIWVNHKPGESCTEEVDKQIQLLEKHEISLQSFQMPPPAMFRRFELLRKLRRESVA